MSRLAARPGELIDRSHEVGFLYDGKPVTAFRGDTFGSALYASGRRVFSRSFKYHRPRGLMCCTGHCANCQMTVDGEPNVRVCVTPVREGAVVTGQNYVGSLDRDLMRITDRLGGPFTPPGFYYKAFIRPRRLWPLYERLLRRAAGLGKLDPDGTRSTRVDVVHEHADVVVIGGGEAGVEAAVDAATRGEHVVLVDEGPIVGGALVADRDGSTRARKLHDRAVAAGVLLLAPAVATGVFEHGLVPVVHGDMLVKIRAGRVVVAAGSMEQPLVFPGNDLVGVMLPEAVRRLVNLWSVKPGERAFVITADDRGHDATADLAASGVEIVGLLDLREEQPPNIEARGRRGRVESFAVNGRISHCDLVVMSGTPQPNVKLLAQAGARVAYDARRGVFVPTELPAGVDAVGSAAGHAGDKAVAPTVLGHRGDRCLVCFCEDQTAKDLSYAVAEGFDSIELAKRYTTVTMGPCQGRLCQLNSIRVYARTTGLDEGAIGATTARPPHTPVTLGVLAGRGGEPVRRTALHHRHEELGARMMWTGPWKRPHSYRADSGDEARHVHRAVGVIDVSTLGKILVTGPEAGVFLDRVYPNRLSDLRVGRIRYGVLTSDAGRIMDDGVVVRLDDEAFYVTTTSSGADAVYQWFTWWNAVWRLDARFVQLTGAVSALNVAGPRARDLMERVSGDDFSSEGFPYLGARHVLVAGVPCLALRIGFVGELGYELHVSSPLAEHLWDTLLERGADLDVAPFGLEPQRILRLEKGHPIVGQDTDSESNLHDAGMPWLVDDDKDFDWVGKWAARQAADRGPRWMLVGFESPTGVMPVEGGQVVVDGRPSGRVTSVRRSAELGQVIGLAIVPHRLAVDGGRIDVQVKGRPVEMRVHVGPFFDPAGERLRA